MARKRRPGQHPVSGPPPAAPRPNVGALSSRHLRTLEMIFETPVRSNIRWSEFVALIRALGGTVSSGEGSRRRVFLVRPAVFHEPHPESTIDKGAVKSVREFLRNVGVHP
jgi:HicA toxin of bacterial toxin-antitoxin,